MGLDQLPNSEQTDRRLNSISLVGGVPKRAPEKVAKDNRRRRRIEAIVQPHDLE